MTQSANIRGLKRACISTIVLNSLLFLLAIFGSLDLSVLKESPLQLILILSLLVLWFGNPILYASQLLLLRKKSISPALLNISPSKVRFLQINAILTIISSAILGLATISACVNIFFLNPNLHDYGGTAERIGQYIAFTVMLWASVDALIMVIKGRRFRKEFMNAEIRDFMSTIQEP